MRNRFEGVEHFYLASGYTDMRSGVNSLVQKITAELNLDPLSKSAFLFCGRRCDRIKVLIWEGDGFLLMYKHFLDGKLQWPRDSHEARELTTQQLTWLLEGLKIDQKKVIRKTSPIL